GGGAGGRGGGGGGGGGGGAGGRRAPPVRGIAAGVGVGRLAAQLFGAGHIRAIRREHRADRESERVARVPGRAGQPEGRFAGEQQRVAGPDLDRREAGQHLERGADVAGADRPRPR